MNLNIGIATKALAGIIGLSLSRKIKGHKRKKANWE